MLNRGRNACSAPAPSQNLGVEFSKGRLRPLRTRDYGVCRSEQLGFVGVLGLPLSVTHPKGEDDQRQAHHYRENTDEWR